MKLKNLIKKAVLAGVVLSVAQFTFMNNSICAEDVISSQEVLEDTYAGAAEVLEAVPTEEEIALIVEANANAWKNPGALVMADVNNSVNVRENPDAESSKVGLLYKDCGGYIVEYTDEWTKIESGNVVGWINNDYLLFGDEAEALADEVGALRATITTTSLRVRKEPNLDSGVYGLVGQGDAFELISDDGEWLDIEYEGAEGFISSEYADISFHLDYGETMEEIKEREAAEKAAKREAERNKYYGVYAASATDVELLGALIQCEAGNQPYEGKVAVGAVVLNRVRSGAYPSSIYGVVYASGQFTPAGTGAVDKRLANGVSSTCIKAAEEVINGYSNVGSATHFRPASSGHDGIVIGGHVFW